LRFLPKRRRLIVKIGDSVMIRPQFLAVVKGYQSKMLQYRRLTGTVKKVTKDYIDVDFTQYDLPPQGRGRRYGDKVKVNRTFYEEDLPVGRFPPEFIEAVMVRENA
jgi:hypothetical protein